MKWFLGAILLTFFSACSTTHFKPSRSVEKAPTIEEAALLCAEYQISEESAVTNSLVSRDEFKPWFDCTEDAYRSHPDAQTNERFVLLYRELALIVQDLSKRKNITSYDFTCLEVNVAMSAALHLVADSKHPVTEEEHTALKKVLPKFSLTLVVKTNTPREAQSKVSAACRSYSQIETQLQTLTDYRAELTQVDKEKESVEIKKLDHRIDLLEKEKKKKLEACQGKMKK